MPRGTWAGPHVLTGPGGVPSGVIAILRGCPRSPVTCDTRSSHGNSRPSSGSQGVGSPWSSGLVATTMATSCLPKVQVTSPTRCSRSPAWRRTRSTDKASGGTPSSWPPMRSASSQAAWCATSAPSCGRSSTATRTPSCRRAAGGAGVRGRHEPGGMTRPARAGPYDCSGAGSRLRSVALRSRRAAVRRMTPRPAGHVDGPGVSREPGSVASLRRLDRGGGLLVGPSTPDARRSHRDELPAAPPSHRP